LENFSMKKTLIALAAVAAVTAVSAQNVSLYGRMDLGYNSTKTSGADSTDTKTTSLAGAQDGRTGSRLGVTGSEDLGGGLKAAFTWETSINADRTASSVGGTRQAFLAVNGGFGTVAVGTFYNVFDDMLGAAVGTHSGDFVWTPGRSENAIGYTAPAMGGLVLSVGTSNEKTTVAGDTTAKANGYVLGARYNAGPLGVIAGYSNAKALTRPLALNGAPLATFAEAKFSEFAVRAQYNLGVAVPYIIVADTTLKGEVSGSSAKFKSSGNEIGATFPMGALTPFVAFSSAKYKGDGDTLAKYSGNSVGATYSLSKRTSVYAQTSNEKLKDGIDAKTRTTKVGLIHTF